MKKKRKNQPEKQVGDSTNVNEPALTNEPDLVTIVAALADRLAIGGEHVRVAVERNPNLLNGHGKKWKPEDITDAIALQANRINRDAFHELVQRYGANQPKPSAEFQDVPAPAKKRASNPSGRQSCGKKAARKEPEKQEPESILGKSVKSALRWIGKEGWTLQQAMRVVVRLDLEVSDELISRCLQQGKSKKCTKPVATFTLTEEDELYKLTVKKPKNPTRILEKKRKLVR